MMPGLQKAIRRYVCLCGVVIGEVHMGGFEPPHRLAPPPQDGVSTNSTTCAKPSHLLDGYKNMRL